MMHRSMILRSSRGIGSLHPLSSSAGSRALTRAPQHVGATTATTTTTTTTTKLILRTNATMSPKKPKTESLLDSASDYFGALRWRAANALTASLSPDERSRLWERLDPDGHGLSKKEPTQGNVAAAAAAPTTPPAPRQSSNHVPTISIAEAVAAARAQEAQLHNEKWEREKERLIQEAEKAAYERVESSLAIQKRRMAFEAWKQSVEKSQQENQPSSPPQQQQIPPIRTPTPEIQEAFVSDELPFSHPILGPVVADLGHKRIHLVSAQALSAIPVWRKQRIYRHGRAKSMASDKLKTMHLGLPGIIGIYEDNDGNLSILDGQHRVGMMQVLQEKKLPAESSTAFDFDRILVEVYRQPKATGTSSEEGLHNQDDDDASNNDSYAQEIFLEVNKAEPVKLVDLPGVAKSSHRNIINAGASRLQEQFPSLFSESQRCRPPHLNIDNLRDALFASNVLDRHSLKSAKALETWIMGQNDLLATKLAASSTGGEGPPPGVSASAWSKAVEFGFYLGLDSSWYYN